MHYTDKRMYVCLSFMRFHIIHPIAMKFWEVVEYTPSKVSEILHPTYILLL